MDCTSHQPLLRNSQCSAICDAFFMSDKCLYFICIIYCAFVWPIYQIVVLFWGGKKKMKKDNGGRICLWMSVVGVEGAHNLWQISVLRCCFGPWEASGCMCNPPAPRALLTICTVRLLPHSGLYFRKNVCHQPLNMCLNDISPVCLWECLLPRDNWIFVSTDRDYRDATDQIRGPKCLRIKTSKRQIKMGDQILLPTVCWWPFVPWFCGLNCMPMFILSYQSGIFGICTQLSHSTRCKTGTFCSIADEYGYS